MAVAEKSGKRLAGTLIGVNGKRYFGQEVTRRFLKDLLPFVQQLAVVGDTSRIYSKPTPTLALIAPLGPSMSRNHEISLTYLSQEDLLRTRCLDFHIQYGQVLPTNIQPGVCQLRLVMMDRHGDKLGSTTIAFEIGVTP